MVERDRVLQWEAPEVRRGGQLTMQSDVWSLGVLVVECVKGNLPFAMGTPIGASGNFETFSKSLGAT